MSRTTCPGPGSGDGRSTITSDRSSAISIVRTLRASLRATPPPEPSRSCGQSALPLRAGPDADRSAPGGLRDGMAPPNAAAADLYWIPLGAGGHSVRFNGRVFEAVAAARQHRPRCDLYHAALVVDSAAIATRSSSRRRRTPTRRAGASSPPAPSGAATSAAGACSATRCAAGAADRSRTSARRSAARPGHRPIRRSPGGCSISSRPSPTPVWGRDELHAGEMWNSNSVIAWLLATAGLPAERLHPPARGRAPGWDAGLVVAHRAGA